MYDEFNAIYKIIYIVSLVILEYLKIYIVNIFSENHLQMILMMVDLLYYPLYLIERFPIEGFSVFDVTSFTMNTVVGVLNIFLMLMFNEMLECNFWGLNKDLTKHIIQRQDFEKTDDIERLTAESDCESELEDVRKSENESRSDNSVNS